MFVFYCVMGQPINASDTNGGPINASDTNGEPINFFHTTVEQISASNTTAGQKFTDGIENLMQIDNNKLYSDFDELHQQNHNLNEHAMLTNSQIKAKINRTALMTSNYENFPIVEQLNSFSEILLGILQLLSPTCHLVIAYDEAHATSQELAILMQLPFPHTVN